MRLWLQILQGNNEKDKVVTNDLNPAIPMARFIRIHPKTWRDHISLRFEVLGCEVTGNHIYTKSCIVQKLHILRNLYMCFLRKASKPLS